MRFEAPLWFVAAAAVLAGLFYLHRRGRRAGAAVPAILFANLDVLAKQAPTWRVKLVRKLWILPLLAMLLMIAALARPQSGRSDSVVLSEGIDIMLIVDTSGSMAAMDFGDQKTRIWHAKEVMKQFVKGRSSDRIGLVSFGMHAYLRCPMTLDYGLLEGFFENVHSEWERAFESGAKKASQRNARLTPQERDQQATAVGDGLVAALARLDESPSKSRVVVLLTDGESNAGETEPLVAADLAKSMGVKVYTIGAGSNQRAPVMAYDAFGRKVVAYQVFPIDEKTLTEMANRTGGRYFPVRDRRSLEATFEEIDKLERSELKVKDYREWDELFQPLAFAALALLCLHALLAQTILRTTP